MLFGRDLLTTTSFKIACLMDTEGHSVPERLYNVLNIPNF